MAVNSFYWEDFLRLYGEVNFEELKKQSFDFGMEVEGNLEEGEFSVEVTPERPDMYSIEGFVRSLRGFSGKEVGLPKFQLNPSDVDLLVSPETADVRPYIGAAIVKDVNVDEDLLRSIIRFQEKLHLTWGRKRSKVAIGIYDFDRIEAPVNYRMADPSESFIPLGAESEMTLQEILEEHAMGIEYKHLLEDCKRYPLLVDARGEVLSFPPIINSNHSGKVSADTHNLFVEVTGTHEPTLIKTVNMLATSLADRGGVLHQVSVKYSDREINYPVMEDTSILVPSQMIADYLGIDLDSSKVKEYLEKMRYGVEVRSEDFMLTVPSYRVDVLGAVDVIEDIAVAHGYSNFVPRTPMVHSIGKGHEREECSNYLRDICTNMGLVEAMTLTLTGTHDQYNKMLIPRGTDYVSVLNSKSAGHDIARLSILPELLKFLRNNKNRVSPISIFELDDTIIVDKELYKGARDVRKLAIMEMDGQAEFARARSLVGGLLDSVGFNYTIKAGSDPFYISGRAGDVYAGEVKIGSFGEFHPRVLNNFGLELPVVAAEFNVDALKPYIDRGLFTAGS